MIDLYWHVNYVEGVVTKKVICEFCKKKAFWLYKYRNTRLSLSDLYGLTRKFCKFKLDSSLERSFFGDLYACDAISGYKESQI